MPNRIEYLAETAIKDLLLDICRQSRGKDTKPWTWLGLVANFLASEKKGRIICQDVRNIVGVNKFLFNGCKKMFNHCQGKKAKKNEAQ